MFGSSRVFSFIYHTKTFRYFSSDVLDMINPSKFNIDYYTKEFCFTLPLYMLTPYLEIFAYKGLAHPLRSKLDIGGIWYIKGKFIAV